MLCSTTRLVPCTRLLIAAGAWSPEVFRTLFPSSKLRIAVTPLAGHSLLLRSPRWSAEQEEKGCHAVFATDESGFSPEVFSRIGGEIYVAGLNSSRIPLPKVATDAKISDEAVARLKEVAKRMLGLPDGEDDLEILREGLCFRPVTSSGRPIVSRVPDQKFGDGLKTRGDGEGGVFVAAGHGAWGMSSWTLRFLQTLTVVSGISQSLGTGKVMAEMLEGQPTSANVQALSL